MSDRLGDCEKFSIFWVAPS